MSILSVSAYIFTISRRLASKAELTCGRKGCDERRLTRRVFSKDNFRSLWRMLSAQFPYFGSFGYSTGILLSAPASVVVSLRQGKECDRALLYVELVSTPSESPSREHAPVPSGPSEARRRQAAAEAEAAAAAGPPHEPHSGGSGRPRLGRGASRGGTGRGRAGGCDSGVFAADQSVTA